jgi:hypothetical protein
MHVRNQILPALSPYIKEQFYKQHPEYKVPGFDTDTPAEAKDNMRYKEETKGHDDLGT